MAASHGRRGPTLASRRAGPAGQRSVRGHGAARLRAPQPQRSRPRRGPRLPAVGTVRDRVEPQRDRDQARAVPRADRPTIRARNRRRGRRLRRRLRDRGGLPARRDARGGRGRRPGRDRMVLAGHRRPVRAVRGPSRRGGRRPDGLRWEPEAGARRAPWLRRRSHRRVGGRRPGTARGRDPSGAARGATLQLPGRPRDRRGGRVLRPRPRDPRPPAVRGRALAAPRPSVVRVPVGAAGEPHRARTPRAVRDRGRHGPLFLRRAAPRQRLRAAVRRGRRGLRPRRCRSQLVRVARCHVPARVAGRREGAGARRDHRQGARGVRGRHACLDPPARRQRSRLLPRVRVRGTARPARSTRGRAVGASLSRRRGRAPAWCHRSTATRPRSRCGS